MVNASEINMGQKTPSPKMKRQEMIKQVFGAGAMEVHISNMAS